jgi:alkanesulfonate monooxygenase SsuD/methylene tetrahydromethanopterin reductase-like flavin-dependent oxidoreductase (luciferase family)
MRALWSGDKTTFEGDFFSFHDCISKPRPAQGSIPVVVGGDSAAAARRAGRLGDGYFPGGSSIEHLTERIELAQRTAEEHGRDPAALTLIAGAMAPPGPKLDERIEQLAAIGVSQAIVPTFPPDQLADIGRTLTDTYADV